MYSVDQGASQNGKVLVRPDLKKKGLSQSNMIDMLV